MCLQTGEDSHMTEEELGAWRIYVRLEEFGNASTLKESWHDLSYEEQQYYIRMYNNIQIAAQRLASDIDKQVFSKLVDQEHWT